MSSLTDNVTIATGASKRIGSGMVPMLSKTPDIAPLLQEVASTFATLDVLVNNAGVFRFAAFADQGLIG